LSGNNQNDLPVRSPDRLSAHIPSNTPDQEKKEQLRNMVDRKEFKTPVDGKLVKFKFPEFVKTQVDLVIGMVYYVFNLGDLGRHLQIVTFSSDRKVSAENREFESA